MAQVPPEWEELPEFADLLAKMIAKYPEFDGIDATKIIAWACTNKDKPESKEGKKVKSYDMSGTVPPESFTNSKWYFVKLFKSDWEVKTEEQKLWMAISVLDRIDPAQPGKVLPLDYKDQSRMVRTLGADWEERGDLPHPLKTTIEFRR
jgi:hypothetical protein